MCYENCPCLVCEVKLVERYGFIDVEEIDPDDLTRDQQKNLDLFDEYLKAGIRSI